MTPESKKALGRVIKAHRERLSWTQERLAGAADVNLRTVQRAESGQGISKDGLGAIAAALHSIWMKRIWLTRLTIQEQPHQKSGSL